MISREDFRYNIVRVDQSLGIFEQKIKGPNTSIAADDIQIQKYGEKHLEMLIEKSKRRAQELEDIPNLPWVRSKTTNRERQTRTLTIRADTIMHQATSGEFPATFKTRCQIYR